MMSENLNVFKTNSNSVNITKVTGFEASFSLSESKKEFDTEKYGLGCVLDVETTGTNIVIDEIIQISFRVFCFERTNTKNLKIGENYNFLNQPSKLISEKITSLTGLSNSDVKGKKIPWPQVFDLLEKMEIVIAHNASFDRSFIDRENRDGVKLNWACSCHQIDWLSKGFSSTKLELLCVFSGFFGDFHSASSDVDLLFKLLTLGKNTNIFSELLEASQKPVVRSEITGFPYEQRHLLKDLSYRWFAPDKVWFKVMYTDQYKTHKQELENLQKQFQFSFNQIKISADQKFSSTRTAITNFI